MEKVYIKDRFADELNMVLKNINHSFNSNTIGFTQISGESGIGRTAFLKELYNLLLSKYQETDIVITANETPIGKFNVSDLQPYRLISQIISRLKDSKKISAEKKLAINAGLTLLSAIPVIGEVPYAFKSWSNDWQMYKLEKEGSTSIKDGVTLDLISTLESFVNKKPLIILIDDLQWTDKPSIDLLFAICNDLKNNNLHIIFTSKKIQTSENNIYADFLKYLEKTEVEFNKLEINPFSKELTIEYCSNFTDTYGNNFGKNEEFSDWIYKKTLGNPSYLLELMRYFKRNNPFDNSGNLQINLKSDVFVSLDTDTVLDNINEIFDIEEKQILSICSCEGRVFTAYMISQITQIDILNTIKKLKSINLKSDVIQSKGMEVIYGVKTTVYEFSQTNYYQYFDSLLEYEERISIHSRIAKELQDRLKNTDDEKLKELLVPYIAAHSAEAENTDLYNQMVDISDKNNEKYGLNLNKNSTTNSKNRTTENIDTIAKNDEIEVENSGMINSVSGNNGQTSGISFDKFKELRKNIVLNFENQRYNEIINSILDYRNQNAKLSENEEVQLNSFLIRTYSELGEFGKAKEIIENSTKNNLLNSKTNVLSECFYLNSIAMYYIEQKKYNQAFDVLKNAAKRSLKLPIELKLMTMINIYKLLKITDPDKSKTYKIMIDKMQSRVAIKL